MSCSLDFLEWLSILFKNDNNFIKAYACDLIGWEICKYDDKTIPLFQSKIINNEIHFRINPSYYKIFKRYFELELEPQI